MHEVDDQNFYSQLYGTVNNLLVNRQFFVRDFPKCILSTINDTINCYFLTISHYELKRVQIFQG